MRRRVVLACLAGGAMAAGFVACGLDESGQGSDGGNDATMPDSQLPDVFEATLPDVSSCKTLNVSACSDASLPDGWSYAAIAFADAACPSVAYEPTALVYSIAPQNGTCSCGCATDGGYTCAGPVVLGGGAGGCNGNGSGTFDAGPGTTCFDTSWTDHHVSVDASTTAFGSPTCAPFSSGTAGWSGQPVTACTPACDASDFCTLGAPFARCIISSNGGQCPAPFTVPQAQIGSSSSVVASCKGCSCNVNANPGCDAGAVAFSQTGCDAGVSSSTLNTTGTACVNTNVNVMSLALTVSTPPTTCSTDGGGANATFGASFTVCCLP